MTTAQGPAVHPEVRELIARTAGVRTWQHAVERAIAHPERLPDALSEARELFRAEAETLPCPNVAHVSDHLIDRHPDSLRVRLFRSTNATPSPWILYAHGGGWVAGDIDTHDGLARQLCLSSNASVLSVDYRLAPEHRFPDALNDVLAAAVWALKRAPELGLDDSRWAVAGDSAGATLVAGACLDWRDRGGCTPLAQILLYPALDRSLSSESMRTLGTTYPPTATTMRWLWQMYAPREANNTPPLLAPLQAERLSDLPAALIITAGLDPLRDEGEHYASRLRAAGVLSHHERVEGVPHGFLRMPLGIADETFASVGDFARTTLHANSDTPSAPAEASPNQSVHNES